MAPISSDPSTQNQPRPARHGAVTSKKISFPPRIAANSTSGDSGQNTRSDDATSYQLVANLDLPAGSAPHEIGRWAIVAHCFTCHRRSPGVTRISKALAAAGIGTLRLDFQGLGDSGGSFTDSSLSANIRDLLGAADWLVEHAAAPSLIVGHSLGGAAAVHAAAELVRDGLPVEMLATVGAPCDPRTASVAAVCRAEELNAPESMQFEIPGRGMSVGRDFLEDLAEFTPAHGEAAVSDLMDAGVRLRFFHSPVDQTVAFRQARAFAQAAGIADDAFGSEDGQAKIIPIDYADHLLTWPGSAQRVGEAIASECTEM